MGKHKKHPEHENLERWLVSYADFITLLFATFTALYAIAQADLAKVQDVSEAIQKSFKEQSLISGIKSIMQGKSPPQDNPNPIASEKGAGPGLLGEYERMTYQPGEVKAAEEMTQKLQQEIEKINKELAKSLAGQGQGEKPQAGEGASGPKDPESEQVGLPRGIELSVQERGVKVSFDSRLFFDSGSAVLKPQAREILSRIAPRLYSFGLTHLVQVEGHTDNQPISTAIFPSNWELSSARASSVVRFFVGRFRFNPQNMAAVGYADSRPTDTNFTADGRSRNRRIDIVIYSQSVGNQIDPTEQAAHEVDVVDPDAKPKVSFNASAHHPSSPRKPKPTKGPAIQATPVKSHGATGHETSPKPTTVPIPTPPPPEGATERPKAGTQRERNPEGVHPPVPGKETSPAKPQGTKPSKPSVKKPPSDFVPLRDGQFLNPVKSEDVSPGG